MDIRPGQPVIVFEADGSRRRGTAVAPLPSILPLWTVRFDSGDEGIILAQCFEPVDAVTQLGRLSNRNQR